MKGCLALLLLLIFSPSQAQFSKKVSPFAKWGKVTAEDLQRKSYPIDPSAEAVVLADIGGARIAGNDRRWFSYYFKRHRVVHILDNEATGLARLELSSGTAPDGTPETLVHFRANVYHLENGAMVMQTLGMEDVVEEPLQNGTARYHITLPGVREGTIIEYEWERKSTSTKQFDPWQFEGAYPALWSEYTVAAPYFMRYLPLMQGYLPMALKEEMETQDYFVISDFATTAYHAERNTFLASVSHKRWVVQNAKAIRDLPFAAARHETVSQVEMRLLEYRDPLPSQRFLKAWPDVIKDLEGNKLFGAELARPALWMRDAAARLTAGAHTAEEKARRIYAFVRDSFACTNHEALYLSAGLITIYQARKGNVADINLLLTALLRAAEIQAHPAILSTQGNASPDPQYPLMERFNYVLCRALIDSQLVWLDASQSRLGYGRLLPFCNKGNPRPITQSLPALPVANPIAERRSTFVLVLSQAEKLSVHVKQTLGQDESFQLRDQWAGMGSEAFWQQVARQHAADIRLYQKTWEKLEQPDAPVSISYAFDLQREGDGVIKLLPVLEGRFRENPFSSPDRAYPVELPAAFEETYTLTFHLPEGYAVKEVPKSMRLALNDQGAGSFEYLISHSGSTISLRSTIRVARARFEPDEYAQLHKFFGLIALKQSEAILLKKEMSGE